MRQQLTDLISHCDIFSVPVGLKSNSKCRIKTCFAGVVSIIIAAFYLYFLITKIISITNYQNITSVSSQQKISNNSAMETTFTTFAFGIDQLTNVQFLTLFSPFIDVYKNNELLESYTLQKCKISRWTGLSNDKFVAFNLGNLLCPQNFQPFRLDGTRKSLTPDFIKITIKGCKTPDNVTNTTQPTVDPELNYTCDELASKTYLSMQSFMTGDIQLFFYIYDIQIATQQITSIRKQINFNTKALITSTTGTQMYIQWSSIKILTDTSIHPWSTIQQQDSAYIDTIRTIPFPIDVNNISMNNVAVITFTMNDKLVIINRKVQKLVNAFAITGGFFAFFIPVLAYILVRYNMYVYDLQVTQKTFREQQNAQKPFGAHTFYGFIKYSLYRFFKRILCCRIGWKDCKQISRNKRQATNLMEISHLLKRIQTLQTSVDYSVNRNQAECLVLLQQKTLKQARNARLKANYYSAIIRQRSHVTISDLRKTYDATDMTLEQFYKTKLESKSQNKNVTETALQILVQDSYLNAINGPMKQSENTLQSLDKSKNSNETQPKIEFKNNKADLQLLDKILSSLQQIKNQAAAIELSTCYTKIEERMAKSFFNMKSQARVVLQQRIPLLILCRLMTKIKALRAKRAQEYIKRSQLEDQIAENNENGDKDKETNGQEKGKKVDNQTGEKDTKQKQKKQKHKEIDSDQEDKMNQAQIEQNQAHNFKSWIVPSNNDNQDHKL